MKEFFSGVIGALPGIASSPLALVALLVLLLAATFLFWKQASFRSLAKTIESLPEQDRLARIELEYGIRPKSGVDVGTWLQARRQGFTFWGYISTIAVLFLGVIVLYGKVVELPGGMHREELRVGFARLHERLSALELRARNLRDAFSLAGANAIEPDPETDRILTERIEQYNLVYRDLRTNQQGYLEPVVRWLDGRPDLASEVNGLVRFALEDLHQAGIVQFNDVAYRRTQQFRALQTTTVSDQRGTELRLLRMDGALEIQTLSTKLDSLLDVLAHRLSRLSDEIMG